MIDATVQFVSEYVQKHLKAVQDEIGLLGVDMIPIWHCPVEFHNSNIACQQKGAMAPMDTTRAPIRDINDVLGCLPDA